MLVSCEKSRNGYSELVFNTPESENTKTHLVPDAPNRLFDVIWDDGDQAKLYDAEGGEGVYTNLNVYDDANNEVAHFGGEGVDITSTVNAFYPPSIALSPNTFTLPSEQMYRPKGDGYMINYPMWAQETNKNHIWFRNLTGILVLRIKGIDGTLIRRVTVKDPSDPHGMSLRGTYSVTASGSTHTTEPVVTPISREYGISLNCEANPTILSSTEPSLFYLSVPGSTHSRLLVGLEYMLPGSSVWYTTYQLVYAQSYNAPHFKFERSKWSLIDLDFSLLDGSLLYEMREVNLNPDQLSDTVADTEIPITTTFHEYTFAIDITPDDITSTDENGYYRKTIYSEMDLVQSSWKGIIIRLGKQNNRGNTYIEVAIGSSTTLFSTTEIESGVRHQVVVTIQNYNNNYGRVTIYFMKNGSVTSVSTTFRKNSWISSENPKTQVGGDQHISGRYYDGEMHVFKIYSRVWSQQEINDFITE